ncbi:MAG: iron chelate uptake ABC transporter family permease subunit [Flaviflexus sp.]|nr:iron chelate uptake ABC transporter family permease subunit [Flaviflexus sp.]
MTAPAALKTPSAPPAPAERHSGSLPTRAAKTRYVIILTALLMGAAFFTFMVLSYRNPMPPGSQGFWIIAKMRGTNLVVMAVVAICQACATVAFQTVTANRIITPSIMGFEALYVAIQTTLVFIFGIAGVTWATPTTRFFLQAAIMVAFASLLYGWLLSGRFGNMHIMLLVGVVIGGGLGALSTFMQRLLAPSEFDVLAAKLFGSVANADGENLPYVIPIVLIVAGILFFHARRLNVLALGADLANNLGLDHRRETMKVLFLVSVLMAMTTSLVGPMTFLGFLVATLAYQAADTYDHRLIFPLAVLIGYNILAGAYTIMRHVFYAYGVVTVIIEMIGGLTFLIVIMKKGRL